VTARWSPPLQVPSERPDALAPAADAAREIAGLWWLLFWVGSAVFLVTMGFALWAAWRGRRGRDRGPTWAGRPLVVTAGILVPLAILVPVFTVVMVVGDRVADAEGGAPGDLRIEVVGHMFWWEVRYEPDGAVTANEIHVPVGRPVTLELRTEDVIHSVWVPNLAGKRDMIPGETTHLRFTADRPGVYEGFCAEYCGIQHARMRFRVIAQPPEEFDAWLARLGEPAVRPQEGTAARGREVFVEVGCASCHVVRGTVETRAAAGIAAPDLTHFASRTTLGAGILPNSRGELGGWLLDPQAAKPGNRMPPIAVPPEDLHALLDYLEALE
jgi:cytochrome c oxidase subunit II